MVKIKNYLPYLAGVGIALTWGLSFIFTKGALDLLAPFHLLGLRFAAATLSLALLRAFKVIKVALKPADYRTLLPLSLFQPILYFTFETAGIMLTSASYTAMLIAAIPIFVALLSALFLRERPNRKQLFFITSSVAGVIFIVYMSNHSFEGASMLGTLILLGAVLSGALYTITSRKASEKYSPLQMTWVMMAVGAAVFNLIALFQHLSQGTFGSYLAPLASLWPSILYLGVASSVGAFFLYNYVLSKVSATEGAVFVNMVTVVAVAGGAIFMAEPIFWYHLVGTAAIVIGVWGTNHYSLSGKAASPDHQ